MHQEGFFPGPQGRKGVPGKEMAKERQEAVQVDVQPSVWDTVKGLLWPEQRGRDECGRNEPNR